MFAYFKKSGVTRTIRDYHEDLIELSVTSGVPLYKSNFKKPFKKHFKPRTAKTHFKKNYENKKVKLNSFGVAPARQINNRGRPPLFGLVPHGRLNFHNKIQNNAQKETVSKPQSNPQMNEKVKFEKQNRFKAYKKYQAQDRSVVQPTSKQKAGPPQPKASVTSKDLRRQEHEKILALIKTVEGKLHSKIPPSLNS